MSWAFLDKLTEILNMYDPPQASAGAFIHTDNLVSIEREQMRVIEREQMRVMAEMRVMAKAVE